MMRLFANKNNVRRAEAAPVQTGCGCCTSRRQLLMGFGAAAAAAGLAAPSVLRAQTQAAPRRIIDMHAHLTPPQYVQDLAGTNLLQSPTLQWTIGKHLEDMDQAGVDVTILSVTTPGIWFGDKDKARRMARYTNDYAAKLASEHPKRFGMFTAIPLPDVEGSMREIEYGLDQQKSDGIALFTSYDGKWLGDPAFDEVFSELNRRKAVVYVHPTSPSCCVNVLPYIPDAMIEYGTDTTRAIVNYIFLGASQRFPDVTMIWSHAGGSMPYMIERYDQAEKWPVPRKNVKPGGFRKEARKFFYDTAQSANVVAMTGLKQVVDASQIVFGTDVPFRTCVEHVKGLESCGVFSPAELSGVWRGNAVRILPRLA